jgi:hypothetical protein
MLGSIARLSISIVVLAAGVIAACHNEMPGPTTPLAPEVGPQGPRPGPITPTPARIDTDSGVPLPSSPEPSASTSWFGHERPTLRVAEVPRDASINDVIDLPPIVDADLPFMLDAGGKPL